MKRIALTGLVASIVTLSAMDLALAATRADNDVTDKTVKGMILLTMYDLFCEPKVRVSNDTYKLISAMTMDVPDKVKAASDEILAQFKENPKIMCESLEASAGKKIKQINEDAAKLFSSAAHRH